ncbi:hypothetical protein LC653_44320 [Nostoc sp. CHAB 5784]|uniref:hypothetical protein n=1 Tax=Nostoc mirabile TaxID=2907820 RepID=UPI001E49A552|nr:hypothetical protein [Nostoc mirabile]MCC5670614.1 hypothetical protein [Nostoc mirabile CHAB5784]
MLEPCTWKLVSTVLRGERGSNASALPDHWGKGDRTCLSDRGGRLCYVCKQRCGLAQRSQKDLA